MKPWLIDVPVKINIWIRPELQKKQWDIIKQVRPKILFIQSDGGRNEEEWNAIKQNRELIDKSLDWECEVHKLYEESNLGLYAMCEKRNNYIWSKVDRCIFLEDDHMPSVSYFKFCAELLEKYKDDQRIEAICGFNNLNKWETDGSDYFFSRRGSIWGMASWSNRYISHKISYYSKNNYITKLLNQIKIKDYALYRRALGYAKDSCFENHPPGPEFWVRFDAWSHHRLFIVPTKNLITCEGATYNATHVGNYDDLDDRLKKLFFTKRYDINFPLKHPSFVLEDDFYCEEYEKSIGEYKEPTKESFKTIFRRQIRKLLNKFRKREIET